MDRKTATATRRRGEQTVRYQKHNPLCLYSSGLIIPAHDCTCGGKGHGYTNVLAGKEGR